MISRYTPLSTVLLALLILTACDPEWDGRWKLTKTDGEPLGSGPDVYYDLSEESIVQIFEDPDGGCLISTFDVSEIDSSVVTTDGAEVDGEDVSESTSKIRFEVSGETLKITFLLGDLEEQTAKRVDGNPRYLAGCER